MPSVRSGPSRVRDEVMRFPPFTPRTAPPSSSVRARRARDIPGHYPGLRYGVVGHDGMAVHDPGVIVGVFFLRPAATPVAAAGASNRRRGRRGWPVRHREALDRPAAAPAGIWIGHFPGAAFPSGHAAQSVAFYAMLAIILGAGRSPWAKAVLWSVATLVALAVGGSRIYLGAHWLTDVLGGYALGASWVATVTIVMLAISSRRTDGAELAVPRNESRRPANQTPTDEPGTSASTVPHGCGLTGGHHRWVRRPGRSYEHGAARTRAGSFHDDGRCAVSEVPTPMVEAEQQVTFLVCAGLGAVQVFRYGGAGAGSGAHPMCQSPATASLRPRWRR